MRVLIIWSLAHLVSLVLPFDISMLPLWYRFSLRHVCTSVGPSVVLHRLLTSLQQKGPKGADDPFTQADINCKPCFHPPSSSPSSLTFSLSSTAQNLIVGGLLTRWSGLKVVGEENLAQVKNDYIPKQST